MWNFFSRRGFLSGVTGAASVSAWNSYVHNQRATPSSGILEGGFSLRDNSNYLPVSVPSAPMIPTLPYTMDNGVKVFNLSAEPVRIYFPDMSDPHGGKMRPINAWGYNGSVIGPTIEAVEGDRVRIIVTNNLPEPTTVHWHGLHLPNGMDGVAGMTQEPIPSGGQFVYEFDLIQSGTYFYHPHFMAAKQAGMGMSGFFIIHPKVIPDYLVVDKDFAFFLQTWMINPASSVPDTLEMSAFNYFTMNGRPGPMIPTIKAKIGERIRIRVANLSMLSHPIHLHGHSFKISEWGAGFLPPSQWILANTINVSSAEVRTMEWTAERVGKWAFHCHFLHHVMNDMHRNPIPGQVNHAGHEMGGMHTIVEVTE